MTEKKTETGPDPREVYADIIDLPHHRSVRHPHMSMYDRSAQFASYKALSGYEDMVAEEARQTDARILPEEHALAVMNRKLAVIGDSISAGQHPVLTFTVFVPDERKAGGSYEEITDSVKRINEAERKVVLTGVTGIGGMHKTIDFDDIIGIRGDLPDQIPDLDQ